MLVSRGLFLTWLRSIQYWAAGWYRFVLFCFASPRQPEWELVRRSARHLVFSSSPDWCSKTLGSNHDNRGSTSVQVPLIVVFGLEEKFGPLQTAVLHMSHPLRCFTSLCKVLQVCQCKNRRRTALLLLINFTLWLLLLLTQLLAVCCTVLCSLDRFRDSAGWTILMSFRGWMLAGTTVLPPERGMLCCAMSFKI